MGYSLTVEAWKCCGFLKAGRWKEAHLYLQRTR